MTLEPFPIRADAIIGCSSKPPCAIVVFSISWRSGMMVRVLLYMTAGLCLLCGPVLLQLSFAQNFPYQVPKAPEFDSRGNLVGPSPSGANPSRNGSLPQAARAPSGDQPGRSAVPARTRRASAPAGMAVGVPPGPIMATPSGGPAPMAAPNAHSSARPPGMPDCSPYPMMIARARSDQEMQAIAKEFLTCLLVNGWDQKRAQQHVITTIESTYSMGRR